MQHAVTSIKLEIKLILNIFSPFINLSLFLPFFLSLCSLSDKIGKEIITRYSTGLQSNKVWYTDANGREMQKRE